MDCPHRGVGWPPAPHAVSGETRGFAGNSRIHGRHGARTSVDFSRLGRHREFSVLGKGPSIFLLHRRLRVTRRSPQIRNTPNLCEPHYAVVMSTAALDSDAPEQQFLRGSERETTLLFSVIAMSRPQPGSAAALNLPGRVSEPPSAAIPVSDSRYKIMTDV